MTDPPTLQLSIEKLVAGGAGLARTPSGVVFVDGVLPGEEIEAQIIKQYPDYRIGRLDKILCPSPARRQPPCPVYRQCGGCQWQHISYAQQLDYKKELVQETLYRQAKITLAPTSVLAAGEWQFRSRFRLSRDERGRWGLKYRRRHRVLALDDCLIARPAIREFLAQQSPAASAGGELQLSESEDGTLKREDEICRWSYGGQQLEYPAAAFFQSNLQLLPRLLDWMATQITSLSTTANQAWDLYAGVGLFSKTLLIKQFRQVIAVESSPLSAHWLAHNLQFSPARVRAQKVEDFLSSQSSPTSTLVVVDPPRQGLSPLVCQQLHRLRAPALIYISCEPSSWARDVQRLAPTYRLQHWSLLDFYPQGSQVELASLLLPLQQHQ